MFQDLEDKIKGFYDLSDKNKDTLISEMNKRIYTNAPDEFMQYMAQKATI